MTGIFLIRVAGYLDKCGEKPNCALRAFRSRDCEGIKKPDWARCPIRLAPHTSENKLQSELNQPRISTGHGRADRAEVGTTQILGGEPELWVVEQIEELRPELKT